MNKILVTLAVLFGVASAQAGILIEPYLGYESSAFKYANASSPSLEYTDKITGTGVGLRLGYKFLIPWVALDYSMTTGKAKAGSPTDVDYDASQTGIGAVIGADLPLIRGWAGYGFSNDFVRKATSTTVETKLKGTYTKVGVGFKIIPFLSLNLEYKMNNVDKIEANGVTMNKSAMFASQTNNALFFSVSAPFNL